MCNLGDILTEWEHSDVIVGDGHILKKKVSILPNPLDDMQCAIIVSIVDFVRTRENPNYYIRTNQFLTTHQQPNDPQREAEIEDIRHFLDNFTEEALNARRDELFLR